MQEGSSLRDYLRILRRRKWLVLQAVLLVPAAAVIFSLRQPTLYEAKADVLLSRQNLAATLTGIPDTIASQEPERVAQTQAELAQSPTVARRALRSAGVTDRTANDFLAHSSVSARTNADLLEFSVTDGDAATAQRLATAYAREYTKYRLELDTAALVRAGQDVQTEIDRLEASGDQGSALYASLVNKQQELRTLEALQTSNAFVMRTADQAEQVQPRPVRNGILGLALGIMLGLGLAFLWEALDTRVRSAEEVGDLLRLPLLARLPAPSRRLRKKDELTMLSNPTSVQAEAFRMLRTNLDFANFERKARTIMVTSALEGEGKSTTVANLALALAHAGRRVVLVDLDLRRPFLSRFFGLEGRPGLTNVLLGDADIEDAISSVAINGTAPKHGNGSAPVDNVLEVLGSGPVPPNAGELVSSLALTGVLADLSERAEIVLIDSPPLLHVGDALALSAQVDAMIVVTQLKLLRSPSLKELHRVLQACPATKLGFVVAGAETEDTHAYGGYYYGGAARERETVG